MQKLPGKILRQQGWEVLDLSEKEFNSWFQDDKVSNVKGWLKEAKARQIKKGIMKEWKAPI
jgi:poly-D-alanine transfer protein DltD